MLKTDLKKLETRDFISVGIFSLIYAVVAFVIGGVAQMTPVTLRGQFSCSMWQKYRRRELSPFSV